MVEKKKESKSQIYTFYDISDDKVSRKKSDCPRCGKGVFMAAHKDRNTCGKCGFTEFKQKPK